MPITSSEIEFIRHPILECRMNPPGVVKVHIMLDSKTKLRKLMYSLNLISSYFNAHQKRSIFALSRQRPHPSMLIWIPWSWSSITNSELVNWLPRSKLEPLVPRGIHSHFQCFKTMRSVQRIFYVVSKNLVAEPDIYPLSQSRSVPHTVLSMPRDFWIWSHTIFS